MNLEELRGHLRANVLRDLAIPSLWQDPELNRYLADAEALFCRRTLALVDDFANFTELTTVAGTEAYKLDERVIRVESVYEQDLAEGERYFLTAGTGLQIPRTAHQGKPTHFTVQYAVDTQGTLDAPAGAGTGRAVLRLYPIPDDAYTFQLRGARKPIKRLTDDTDEPEIDEEYQLLLCDYAAWKALTNNRPEGSKMANPRQFFESWSLGVRDAKRHIAFMRAGAHPRAVANFTGKTRGR